MYFYLFFSALSSFFLFVTKKHQKDDFEKQVACKSPVCWSKYTTVKAKSQGVEEEVKYHLNLYYLISHINHIDQPTNLGLNLNLIDA